jgi:hypothetical protein
MPRVSETLPKAQSYPPIPAYNSSNVEEELRLTELCDYKCFILEGCSLPASLTKPQQMTFNFPRDRSCDWLELQLCQPPRQDSCGIVSFVWGGVDMIA